MQEVFPNLFVGSQADYELNQRDFVDWLVIHACKEPHHRQALGYTGRAADKNHPEYLIAVRGNRLILNLVDVDNPAYIADEIMDHAVEQIHIALEAGRKVFVHCNQGQSRSPAIAMLYLGVKTDVLPRDSFENAYGVFLKLYPAFAPAGGTLGYLRKRWQDFAK